MRCRLGAKPGPHPCPCQPGGGVQQVWLEGGHEATIACPSTINSPSTIATPSTIITGEDFHRDRGWSPAPYISLQGNRLCQEGRWWVKQEMASNIFKNRMIKITLQILQKAGIILFFIIGSKGPLVHQKIRHSPHSQQRRFSQNFHKIRHKRYWGSDKRSLE